MSDRSSPSLNKHCLYIDAVLDFRARLKLVPVDSVSYAVRICVALFVSHEIFLSAPISPLDRKRFFWRTLSRRPSDISNYSERLVRTDISRRHEARSFVS